MPIKRTQLLPVHFHKEGNAVMLSQADGKEKKEEANCKEYGRLCEINGTHQEIKEPLKVVCSSAPTKRLLELK